MPEVLAHAQADAADRLPHLDRPDAVAGARESALVEQAVGRQVDLAVQADQLAVPQQCDAVAVPMLIGLLDEADRDQHAGRLAADASSRGSSARMATSGTRSWSR